MSSSASNTAGNWEDEEIVQGIIENTGTAVPYGDRPTMPLASWNENSVPPASVVRFELGMRVKSGGAKRPARIMVNAAGPNASPQGWSSSSSGMPVGFYGYNAGNNLTYGFLNDPGLPAYVTVISKRFCRAGS